MTSTVWCSVRSRINFLPGGHDGEINRTCTGHTGWRDRLASWHFICNQILHRYGSCQFPQNKLALLIQVVLPFAVMSSTTAGCSKNQQKSKARDLSLHKAGESDAAFNSRPLMGMLGCLPGLPGATENITLVLFRLIISLCSGPKFEKWLTAWYILSSSHSLAHSHSGLVCPKDMYGNQQPA